MDTLRVKIAVLLVVLATLAAIPTQLWADGNPTPVCNGKACIPNG